MDDSLLNKLKSLGVKVNQPASSLPKPAMGYSAEKVLPGEVAINSSGTCFVVRKNYSPDYIHGQIDLRDRPNLGFIAEFSRLPHLIQSSSDTLVFLDTETTGLSPNAGVFPFLTGLCKTSSQGTEVALLLSRSPAEEAAMLDEMIRFLQGARAIVTYNGKSFDIPLLENRLAYHCIPSPFRDLGHIDLLHLTRKLWRNTLPSRSLGYVEMSILGISRAEEEVPGFLIPQLYYDYLKSGDARPLAGVLYHNEMDILALVALLNHLIELSAEEITNLNPEDILSVARLLMDIGDPDALVPLMDRILVQDDTAIDWMTLHKLADWFKSISRWSEAIHLYEKAAAAGYLWAQEELAKYYENHLRDYDQALYWCERMQEKVVEANLAPFSRQSQMSEIQKRLDRITRKISKCD